MKIILNDQGHDSGTMKILRNAIDYAIDYLGLSSYDITAEFIYDDMCDGLNGMIIDDADDYYTIVVDDKRLILHIIRTTFHEMVHMRQHICDGLGMKLDNCSNIPYLEREWEIEAVLVSKLMVEDYIERTLNG